MKLYKIIRRIWLFPIMALLTLPWWGCYPDGGFSSVSDFDTVTTAHDNRVDFSAYQTYAMPDSVMHVIGEDDDPEDIDRQFDEQILSRVAQNMQQIGYTRVSDPAQADVHVANFVTRTTYVGGGCYPPYWGWWYPYPPGWGWCYPVISSYTAGTLVTVMVDPDQPDDTRALWLAGSNGMISGTNAADIRTRINRNIDQAFEQSPYLGAGR